MKEKRKHNSDRPEFFMMNAGMFAAQQMSKWHEESYGEDYIAAQEKKKRFTRRARAWLMGFLVLFFISAVVTAYFALR